MNSSNTILALLVVLIAGATAYLLKQESTEGVVTDPSFNAAATNAAATNAAATRSAPVAQPYSFGGGPLPGVVEPVDEPATVEVSAPVSEPVVHASPERKPPRASGAAVRTIKASVHDRQRTGRFARNAGYNGAFELTGVSRAVRVEEVADILLDGRVVRSQTVAVAMRQPGRFQSKQRISELKTLDVGSYEVRLRFVADGRTIGSHKWALSVR